MTYIHSNEASISARERGVHVVSVASTLKIILWTIAFQLAWHFGKIRAQLGEGHFADPDDFLRLHQVRNWKEGLNGWFDVSVPRMNPPFGGDMHWSRLIDVPIAAITAVFEFLVSPVLAERLAAIVWPTLLLVLTVLVLVNITRKLFPHANDLLTVLFAVTCITAQVEFAPARIDHHNLQILLFCLLLLGLVNGERKWGHALVGFSAVLSVVIGLDLMLMLTMVFAWIGLEWVIGWDEKGQGMQRTGLALGASALLLYPIVVPPSEWLVPKCDAVSSVFLSAFLAIAAGFFALGSATRLISTPSRSGSVYTRAMAGGISGILIILALYALYPQCSAGPMSGISPELKVLWFDTVIEAMGLFAFAREYDIRWFAIPAFVFLNIAFGLYFIVTKKTHPRLIAVWAGLVITFVLGFYQVRMYRIGLFATVPISAITAQMGLDYLASRYRDSNLMKVATSALVIVFLLTPTWLIIGSFTAAFAPQKEEAIAAKQMKPETVGESPSGEVPTWAMDPARAQCGYESDFARLKTLEPGLVFNGINIGPAILVFSDHSIVGGNYHRNSDAIIDTYRFFKGDEANALDMLKRRPVSYIALCKPHPSQLTAKYSPQSFGGQILGGNLPSWLEMVSTRQDHLAIARVILPKTGMPQTGN